MVEALTELLTLGLGLQLHENSNVERDHSSHLLPFSRRTSDHSVHQQRQSPSETAATDYVDVPSTTNVSNRRMMFDTLHDTEDKLTGTTSTSKRHHLSSTNQEHHLPSQSSAQVMSVQSNKHLSRAPLQQKPSHKTYLSVPLSHHHDHNHNHNHNHNQNETNNEALHDADDNLHRRHHRSVARRDQSPSVPPKNPDLRVHRSPANRSSNDSLPPVPSRQPLRIIFIRHGERVNQVFGPGWLLRAFRNHVYHRYDENMPVSLPRRRSYQAFEFDSPLTERGLKSAYYTGRSMKKSNVVADVCLSSCAIRCIQTAERILTGIERQNSVPIRVEPGIFECPHFNSKVADSFMTKDELLDSGFNIKRDYAPVHKKIQVPESLLQYYERCTTVMRTIIDRYIPFGGTVLLVTHAPGLLALTEALKGNRPNQDTFYRTVAAYPPLSMHVATYDGAKWRITSQPFNVPIS